MSLAMIMVLTGVALGIGFGLETKQVLKPIKGLQKLPKAVHKSKRFVYPLIVFSEHYHNCYYYNTDHDDDHNHY